MGLLKDGVGPSDLSVPVDSLPGAFFEEQMQDYKIRLTNRAIQERMRNKTLAAPHPVHFGDLLRWPVGDAGATGNSLTTSVATWKPVARRRAWAETSEKMTSEKERFSH
jgi:hypothetical protein